MARMTLCRTAAAATGALALALTSACGGGSEDDSSGSDASASASASPSAAGPTPTVDLADPGDDLLAAKRSSLTSQGSTVSWRFPKDCYKVVAPRQATCQEELLDLAVAAKPGQTAAEVAAEDADFDGEVTTGRVSVAGRSFERVTVEGPDIAGQFFYYRPQDGPAAFKIMFYSSALEDVAQERTDELYQMLGSLEFDSANERG